MNQTSGDSEAYIVCMSTRKENEKGLSVIANGGKGANFLGLEIALEDATLQSDNTMKTKRGIVEFPPKTFNAVMSNRSDRKTVKSIQRKDNDLVK